jgi:hypothetical protein
LAEVLAKVFGILKPLSKPVRMSLKAKKEKVKPFEKCGLRLLQPIENDIPLFNRNQAMVDAKEGRYNLQSIPFIKCRQNPKAF